MQALPVRAAFALLRDEKAAGRATPVQRDRVDAAADRAIALSAGFPAGDPWSAEVRNLLAYVLVAGGRADDALDQFRLIGPYATSFPWASVTGEALGGFLDARADTRLRVASSTPWRARPEHSGRRGH